jgi:hypothetical protein
MKTNNSIFNNGGKWKPFKYFIDLAEYRIGFLRLFAKPVATFFCETERIIDPFVFVVASEEVNLVRELNLKRHEQAYCFK